MSNRVEPKTGYGDLAMVLDDALEQAQTGKGKQRHTDSIQPFDEQITCSITRREGHAFARGQAIKKIDEAKRLPKRAAEAELLGAINYLAASIIVLREEMGK